MDLNQALITGSFGVAVAIITWLLAGMRESKISKREARNQKREKLENLYATTIAQLEMLLRLTHSGDSYEEIKRELSDRNGMLKLLAKDSVNEKLEEVSILIYQWSTLYRKGAPKRGPGDTAIITSEDSKSSEEAEKLYPQVNSTIVELIKLMKKHIAEYENA